MEDQTHQQQRAEFQAIARPSDVTDVDEIFNHLEECIEEAKEEEKEEGTKIVESSPGCNQASTSPVPDKNDGVEWQSFEDEPIDAEEPVNTEQPAKRDEFNLTEESCEVSDATMAKFNQLLPAIKTKFKIKPGCIVFPSSFIIHEQSDGVQSTKQLMRTLRQDFQHFNCIHCRYIVDDPLECSHCEALICRDCLQEVHNRVQTKKCPGCNQSEGLKFQPIGKFARRHLQSMHFTCNYKVSGCRKTPIEGLPYDQVSAHLKKCLHQEFQCPFNCFQLDRGHPKTVQSVKGMDIEKHLEDCPTIKMQCPKCKISFSRGDFASHDCFQALKLKVTKQTQKIKDLKAQFGMITESFQPRCTRGHLLQMLHGKVKHYNGMPMCDQCSERSLEEHTVFYHCKECSYDLCQACACIKAKTLKKKERVVTHGCEMTLADSNRYPNWACDGRKTKAGNHGCVAGITHFHQARHIRSYRCLACDYDLCIECVKKYKEHENTSHLTPAQRKESFVVWFDKSKDTTRFFHSSSEEEAKHFFEKQIINEYARILVTNEVEVENAPAFLSKQIHKVQNKAFDLGILKIKPADLSSEEVKEGDEADELDPTKNPKLLDQFATYFFLYKPADKGNLKEEDIQKKIFETKEKLVEYFKALTSEAQQQPRPRTEDVLFGNFMDDEEGMPPFGGLERMMQRIQDQVRGRVPGGGRQPVKKVISCLILHKQDIVENPEEFEEGYDDNLYEMCMARAQQEGFYEG